MLSFVLKGFKTVNVKKDKTKYPQIIANKILRYPSGHWGVGHNVYTTKEFN